MSSPNIVRISHANNPELRDFFSRHNAGDTLRITVEFQMTSTSQDETVGNLSEVKLPEDELAPEGETEAEVSALEPAAILIRSGKASE